ncbi:sensor histidine kinase [Paenibacillus sp. HB172176]|uniref:sensor histidine kinase n=1 Tax=Paenibacillus sp. HB172176 TaxID=2493690 RepID=UPI001439EBE7|nr:sensor histidine kinase [Paenibacillus sp. HB172176]
MRIKCCLLIVLALWAVGAGLADASTDTVKKLIAEDEGELYSVNDYMEILEDKDGAWTLTDVQSPELQSQFRPVEGKSSFGYSKSVYWMKATIRNESGSESWLLSLQNPLMDHFNVYSSSQAERITHHYPSYSLQLPPFSDTTIYMRFETPGAFIVPLQLTEPAAIYEKTSLEFVLYGLYYGIILTIVMYMLSLYSSIRNIAYIYYILYILCYSASQFIWDGLALQLLGDNWFTTGDDGVLFASPTSTYEFFFMLSVWFGFLATRRIVKPAAFSPWLDRLCRIVIWLCPVGAIGNAFFYTYGLTTLWFNFKIVAILMLPVVIVGCALRGSWLARRLTIAIVPLYAIALPSSLLSTGILPDNLFTHFGMQFGSVIEFIIMSIVLYEQVRQMREKQHRVQKELASTLANWNKTLKLTVEEQTESLKRSNDELILAEQSRTRLLQNMSHDIRNPLNYVQGGIQALKQKLVQEQDRQQEILDNVYSKVIEVNHFLDEMNRIEEEERPQSLEMVMFAEWIDDIFGEMSTDIRYGSLRCDIIVEVQEDTDVLIAPHAVKRAIINLVHNACKFTPSGGLIILKATQEAKWVTVTVEDTGQGIAAERLPYIFNRHYMENKERGRGLGLAITKEIVERHGGQINVWSAEGRGSRFSFTLPKVQ